MKKLILLIFSSLTFTITSAQQQILINNSPKYVGQKVSICDSVYSVKVLPNLTFVNIGGDYPKQRLTLVFYKKDLYHLNIEPDKIYSTKKICVHGRIIQYEGRPQIVIKSLNQITTH